MRLFLLSLLSLVSARQVLTLTSDSGDSNTDLITNSNPLVVNVATTPGAAPPSIRINGTTSTSTPTFQVQGGNAGFIFTLSSSSFPYGQITFLATAPGETDSNVLLVTFVPAGTYTLSTTTQRTGLGLGQVDVSGQITPPASRTLTYQTNNGGSGTVTSDSTGAYSFSFTDLMAGTIRISGTDIAGNPLRASADYPAFVQAIAVYSPG